ncbi:hypothetical protein SCUCBS95973_001258 [Sporothrix curviconia]|uniref:Transmembrane protein 42 n=1 Tax=Sporothrix curviconia TaxID=1260050 RepID=A0ABP0AX37_9PEZI
MDTPSTADSVPLMDRNDGADSINETPDAPLPVSPPANTLLQRNQWIGLALASGACAAFNGVFAKLYDTFFVLNLVFNGVMWTLFTRALKAGHSATQVSIMNTSANFVLTALLGLAIFSESLPPLWWAGAALLVAGNVIIGRKDEGKGSQEDKQPPQYNDEPSAELPVDEVDAVAVAMTTVSAAAATVGGVSHTAAANGAVTGAVAGAETLEPKGRRMSRRLAAQQQNS